MKLTFVTTVALAAAVVTAAAQGAGTPAGQAGRGAAQGRGPAGPGLTLTTPAFEDGGVIPNKYTQADPNPVSPKLEWTNVPPNTATFALIMHDPDVALKRSTDDVLHWIVFNIPGTAKELPEGVPSNATLSDGTIQPKNSGGAVGYRGPGAPAAGPQSSLHVGALRTRYEARSDAGGRARRCAQGNGRAHPRQSCPRRALQAAAIASGERGR